MQSRDIRTTLKFYNIFIKLYLWSNAVEAAIDAVIGVALPPIVLFVIILISGGDILTTPKLAGESIAVVALLIVVVGVSGICTVVSTCVCKEPVNLK